LLSAYLDKIQRNKPEKKKINEALGISEEMYYDRLEFGDFVEAIVDNPVDTSDPHWDIQVKHLKTPHISYDFIGRLEKFEDDVSFVRKKIGARDKFVLKRHGNEATGASKLLQDYYSDAIAAKVAAHYNDDFKAFGYSRSWKDACTG
jgi:hypothetical protein